MNNFSNNVSWEKILDKYDIIEKIDPNKNSSSSMESMIVQ
jgi:hypothetical protein